MIVLYFLVLSILVLTYANLLVPGIMKETSSLSLKKEEYIGFIQSALNNTEVEIRVNCAEEIDIIFQMEFVIRTSSCAKEFIVDRNRVNQFSDLLTFYFNDADHIPTGYHYDSILYYKSPPQNFSCLNHGEFFRNEKFEKKMVKHNVTEFDPKSLFENKSLKTKKILKRNSIYPGLNGKTIDGGTKISLTSWHPVQHLPVDSIYFLIIKILVLKFPEDNNKIHNIETVVQWRGPNGYLSAIDYPLLGFFELMCFFYLILALVWLIICIKYWRDLLRIQFWIGAVIIVGMIEKAVFYAEYSNMNLTGESIEGLLELAELTSCLKRTMARVLIIIVSVGFGVVKPRLGSTMNKVFAVGISYFLFSSVEGLARVSKHATEAIKQKQIAKIPLAFFEVLIAWWIFSSLVNTMRILKLRKNEIKLKLYHHFTNVLGVATIISIIYILWSTYMHILQDCMRDWKKLWIDTAFWHIFFYCVLVAIMILWRPSKNNQRYAFTPLLDDSEDDNDDDDELFNSNQANVYEMLKQRGPIQGGIEDNQNSNMSKMEEDMEWLENNIPITLAKALIDSEEDEKFCQLEMSKML